MPTGPITKSELFGGHGWSLKDMDPMGITRIVRIIIHHGDIIDSLTVHFECNGTTESTDKWGGKGGARTEINLKTNEYITSVKGYFNDNYFGHEVVSSLTVETNLAVHGPHGTTKGQSFEIPAVNGQIIGFHARAEEFVNAVGVYVKGFIRTKSVLYGGRGGLPKDIDHTGFPRIVKVSIHHGDAIDALSVCYDLEDGTTERTSIWGGNTGVLTEIDLFGDEYIKSVRGYVGYFGDLLIVRSLQLITNKRQCGPFGKEEGTQFDLTTYGGKIIGFHGRSGAYLDAIGIYAQGFIRRKSVLCGGSGGLPKDIDHTGFPRIVKVSIHHGDAIDALSVCYDLEDGTTERTSIWGGNTGVLTEIGLSGNEYIKSVRGYVGYFGDLFIVRSLQLITNTRQCGPYGKEEGTPFELSALGGQIVGFHGRSGAYLDAIGVYYF